MKNDENVKINQRNYGIDLLRIIAMFFVVILHQHSRGGLTNNTIVNSAQYKLCWAIEIFAYCAVNMFAIITGFVSYTKEEKKFKFSNYLNIWLQVVFYGLFVNLIFNIINPSIVTIRDYINALLPVTNKLYWYFTAYTGVVVLMPLLNKAIRNASDLTMKKISIAIIFVFSIIGRISGGFALSEGYSVIWLVLLYIIGATIKKCDVGKGLKWYQIVLAILGLYIFTYMYKIYGLNISTRYIKITRHIFISYLSPTILGVSILYVIGFSKIRFNNGMKKTIKFAAPSAFAVYLINNHPLMWEYVIKDSFVNLSNSSLIKIFTCVVGFSTMFVILSILIDKLRIYIFNICKVKTLTKKIELLLDNILTKLAKLI